MRPFTPDVLDVEFLDDVGGPAVLKSKAVGEPPFLYGIGAWFAVREALRAASPGDIGVVRLPWTHERVFGWLHGDREYGEGGGRTVGLRLERKDVVTGALAYGLGDTVAALVTGDASWLRCVVLASVGATLYAVEIPWFFRWIVGRTKNTQPPVWRATARTLLALMFFNPLWVARHLALIALAQGTWSSLSWDIFRVSSLSFLVNIPISLVGNYIIQVRIPLRGRFLGSAVFSGLLAVYYALSGVWFHG